MAAKKSDMKRLIEQREALLREMEAIKNKIAGLEMAIQLLDDDEAPAAKGKRSSRVKQTVLDLLKEVGTTGLNAATAVDLAGRKGITIERASVSSLLSRLKSEGVIVYDGEQYRLPEYAQAKVSPTLKVFDSGL